MSVLMNLISFGYLTQSYFKYGYPRYYKVVCTKKRV